MNTNFNLKRLSVLAALGVCASLSACGGGSSGGPGKRLESAKLLIEHNATDEDTGYQGFADGEPWSELVVTDPNGVTVATIEALGGLQTLGLTELFFETNEPPNDEEAIVDVLARLPEGDYLFEADVVEKQDDSQVTVIDHQIPAGPQLTAPVDGAAGVDAANTVVSWQPVTQDINGGSVSIAAYQVIVEEDVDEPFPGTYARPVFNAYFPPTVGSVTIPSEFMQSNACYKWEVLAIEPTGNQTLSAAAFGTGTAVCVEEEDEDEEPAMKVARMFIEHNAADEDTGFQSFADGDPWSQLRIKDASGNVIVRATPSGGLDFGMTEFFFESSEPENSKVPIADVLARLPEGTFTFSGDIIGGGESSISATLTHSIPRGPVLVSPAHEEKNVDPANTVVTWQPVTQNLDGEPVTIVGYQVIVVNDETTEDFPDSFAQQELSIHLPANVTSIKIPATFMQADTEYEYEVLAIEASGNQTLSAAEFETAK